MTIAIGTINMLRPTNTTVMRWITKPLTRVANIVLVLQVNSLLVIASLHYRRIRQQ